MNERIKKLINKLDERDVSEVDINAVVLSTHENKELIDKLIKHIDDNSDEKSNKQAFRNNYKIFW